MTELHELKTGSSLSRGEWVCYLGAFKDPVRLEIGGAFVGHGHRRKYTYHVLRV